MGFVQIHNHSEYSPLDGLSSCTEAAETAAADGAKALAITDHGGCYGHPDHQAACDKAGIKPLFGIETYFQPDRIIRPAEGDKEAQSRLARGSHLILLAQDDRGLRDLWAASTEAYATGFYYKPRMDWDLLEKYGTGLIATTSCLGGIISQDLLHGRYDHVWATLDRLKATFPGRLYLEIQANELPEQIKLNQMLALASEQFGIPLVAACDAHYPGEQDAALHKLWMQCQSGKGNDDYWNFSPMYPEKRARELLGYLDPGTVDAAIRNADEIADRCSARISGYADPPVFTRGGTADDDARRLMELCRANWDRIGAVSAREQRIYADRLEREFSVVAPKGLAGCYLIVHDIVSWVRSQGVLVGPGRGSAAGSLMSYLLGITSIDPIPAQLMFERFLTPGRVSLPDFDLDFPSSKRDLIQHYVISTYGEEHVVRVGTVLRYKAKGILNKLFSVLADRLPAEAPADARQIASVIDEAEGHTAGLGLPWDEITQEQAIQGFLEKYKNVFGVAQALYGRVYSYGQHPAGLIISPGTPLAGTMPMRRPDSKSDLLVSQFDFRYADSAGLLKLDLLTIRTLDTAQKAIDLIEKRTGQRLDPRAWTIEQEDPQVFDEIATGQTLGMFQIETSLCRSYCARHQPRSVEDLADLTTYVRPGPRNSGAAESYLRRRAGQEEVSYPHPLLEEHLRRSYGVMLYQEDILTAVRELGGYNDLEADGVRKILGKKLTEKIGAAGEEFIRRCTERGHDREQIERLWEAMAEHGKYSFNRAHGYSYATLSYWTAWLMVHYPVEMTTAVLSTLDDMDRMAAFATDARRKGITVLPPDARFCGADFAISGLSIRYGLSAIKGVGPQAIASITRGQPYATYEDFRQRSGVNAGVLYALAQSGALDELVPSRRGLVQSIELAREGDDIRCLHKDPGASGPNGLPCTYDWDHEPQPAPRYGKGGRQLKVIVKPPPKRCTVACRRYTPPEALDMSRVPEYGPEQLFRMESDIYGCWMSDAVFAQVDGLGPGMREQSRRIALALPSAPEGSYPLVAVYGGSRTARTRAGNTMWWARLVTEVSAFDVAVFSPLRDEDPDLPGMLRAVRAGTLVSAEVIKRSYQAPNGAIRAGWRLADIWALGGLNG
jgi:DNA polymerase III subunit alpha